MRPSSNYRSTKCLVFLSIQWAIRKLRHAPGEGLVSVLRTVTDVGEGYLAAVFASRLCHLIYSLISSYRKSLPFTEMESILLLISQMSSGMCW